MVGVRNCSRVELWRAYQNETTTICLGIEKMETREYSFAWLQRCKDPRSHKCHTFAILSHRRTAKAMWIAEVLRFLIFVQVASASAIVRKESRLLQSTDFASLSCNANGFGICQDFTSVFGISRRFTSLVTIPCGTCVVMDQPTSSTVDFLGGLDIQGKLIFPEPSDPSYSIVVRAPGIVVQGELEMFAKL